MKGSRRVKTSTKSRSTNKAVVKAPARAKSSLSTLAGPAARNTSTYTTTKVSVARRSASTSISQKQSSVAVAKRVAFNTESPITSHARAFTSSTPTRRLDINWKRCESPLAPESVREFKDHESKIDAMWRDVYSAPAEVTPIKWDQWEGKIKDKNAVAALKQEYESKKFTVEKSLYQTAEQAEGAVKAAENQVEFLKSVIGEFKKEIDDARQLSTLVPFMSFYQRIKLVPGLDEEFDRQVTACDQITPETTIRALDTVNPKKIMEELKEGKIPNLPHEAIQAIIGTPVFLEIMKDHTAFVKRAEKYGVFLDESEEIIGEERKRLGLFQDNLSYTQQFEEVSQGYEHDYKNDEYVKEFVARAAQYA